MAFSRGDGLDDSVDASVQGKREASICAIQNLQKELAPVPYAATYAAHEIASWELPISRSVNAHTEITYRQGVLCRALMPPRRLRPSSNFFIRAYKNYEAMGCLRTIRTNQVGGLNQRIDPMHVLQGCGFKLSVANLNSTPPHHRYCWATSA